MDERERFLRESHPHRNRRRVYWGVQLGWLLVLAGVLLAVAFAREKNVTLAVVVALVAVGLVGASVVVLRRNRDI